MVQPIRYRKEYQWTMVKRKRESDYVMIIKATSTVVWVLSST